MTADAAPGLAHGGCGCVRLDQDEADALWWLLLDSADRMANPPPQRRRVDELRLAVELVRAARWLRNRQLAAAVPGLHQPTAAGVRTGNRVAQRRTLQRLSWLARQHRDRHEDGGHGR